MSALMVLNNSSPSLRYDGSVIIRIKCQRDKNVDDGIGEQQRH